jgi:hypothetical protein
MTNPRIAITREALMRLLDGHPVQVATSVGLLEIETTEDPPWQPLTRRRLPPHLAAYHTAHGLPVPDELWTNDIYEVFVAYLDGKPDTGWHLSIKRYDRAPVRNWRHFQQMKNEICGEMAEGVELFPGEYRLADNANQYHLWVMPLGTPITLGFEGGMTLLDPTEVEAFNDNGDPGRQEPLQPGLTMGEGMEAHQRESGASEDPRRRAIIEGRNPT